MVPVCRGGLGCLRRGVERRGRPVGTGSTQGRTSRGSLRWLLAALLGGLAVLIGALILVASLQLHGASRQTQAENRRTASFLLADSVRQSSNDLTNMVRLYAASGNPLYRSYYDQLLAIRAGTAPRPRDYDSSFWAACWPRATRRSATSRGSR